MKYKKPEATSFLHYCCCPPGKSGGNGKREARGVRGTRAIKHVVGRFSVEKWKLVKKKRRKSETEEKEHGGVAGKRMKTVTGREEGVGGKKGMKKEVARRK